MQNNQLFPTLIKCIAHTTLTILYITFFKQQQKMFIVQATTKNLLGLRPRTFYSSLEPIKSQKCYTLCLVKVFKCETTSFHYFSLGIPNLKKFGHTTLGSGGKKISKRYPKREQTDRHTDGHLDLLKESAQRVII